MSQVWVPFQGLGFQGLGAQGLVEGFTSSVTFGVYFGARALGNGRFCLLLEGFTGYVVVSVNINPRRDTQMRYSSSWNSLFGKSPEL